MSDHPRACGANDLSFTDLRGADGSSPRVRGKLLHGRLLRRQRRIIPARAGQTSACVRTSPTRSDHPRACGANNGTYLSFEPSTGSSPRVRGKHAITANSLNQSRIIPARAGQTMVGLLYTFNRPDHPRACGANLWLLPVTWLLPGSSPRVRGKPSKGAKHGNRPRIIPARAGQTSGSCRSHGFCPDHPRACGANLPKEQNMATDPGSSPRVRGKPFQRFGRRSDCRIIPARAGQTPVWKGRECGITDHPRACGANSLFVFLFFLLFGSSPRVRGKLCRQPRS